MKLPEGFQVNGEIEENSDKQYFLKIQFLLYGLKQASFNWHKKLKKALEDIKYVASDIYPCLYLVNSIIVLTYVDDCKIVGNNMKDIDSFIDSLKNDPEKFVLI